MIDVIRVTHTGVYADGRPNTSSVFITDVDFGFQQENRKDPAYVPPGGFIDIPATTKGLFSFNQGDIAGFVSVGIVTAVLIPMGGCCPIVDTLTTTTVVPTVITTVPTMPDAALVVTTTVVGRTVAGVSGAYVRRAHVEIAAGVATVVMIATDFTSEDDPTWDATITTSGGALVIVVTGLAGTVLWKASTDVVEIP